MKFKKHLQFIQGLKDVRELYRLAIENEESYNMEKAYYSFSNCPLCIVAKRSTCSFRACNICPWTLITGDNCTDEGKMRATYDPEIQQARIDQIDEWIMLYENEYLNISLFQHISEFFKNLFTRRK